MPGKLIKITQAGPSPNRSSRRGEKPAYIVIHYTGSPFLDFISTIRSMRNERTERSAHFIVDRDRIFQVVPISDAAWHVAGGQVNSHYARAKDAQKWHEQPCAKAFRGNRNSIGIEMTCTKDDFGSTRVCDTDWRFYADTIETTAQLVAALMNKFNIPLDHVIRHMDATGKPCPRPFVSLKSDNDSHNDSAWAQFLEKVEAYANAKAFRVIPEE